MNTSNNGPQQPRSEDLLLKRYHEANALDTSRPGEAVRTTVLAKAQAASQTEHHLQRGVAANDGQWKLRAFGSVAVVGLLGLLMLQFDQAGPDEQELAWGAPEMRKEQPQATPPVSAVEIEIQPVTGAATTGPLETESPASSSLQSSEEGLQSSPLADEAPATDSVRPETANATPAKPAARLRSSSVASSTSQGLAPAAKVEMAEEAAPAAAMAPAPTMADAQTFDAPAPAASMEKMAPMSPMPSATSPPSDSDWAQANRAAAILRAPIPPKERVKEKPQGSSEDLGRQSAPALTHEPPSASSTQGMAIKPSASAPSAQPAVRPLEVHVAASRGNMAALEHLIAQGRPLNGRDAQGRTPLMLAAMGHHMRAWTALIQAGADPHLADPSGLTAVDHAARAGHTDWPTQRENAR